MQIILLVIRSPESCLVVSFVVLTAFLQASVYLYNFHFGKPRILVAVHFFPPMRFDMKFFFVRHVTLPWEQGFFSPVFRGIFTFLVNFNKPLLNLINLCKIFWTAPSLIMHTFCNSNSIHARRFCKRVSMAMVHV